ncbi:branched chain amino acid aminotransferase [candidate division KSB1 bacterium]|nr:MAG: branched chain amino acid aminotransferase [candidate division KSB1 bacterium]
MERAKLDWENLTFQYVKTDYHLEYYFKDGQWSDAKIVENDTIELNIAATALHYGQECFEGLKTFEQADGTISVFRPDENAKRMVNSARKILMEPFPEEKFLEAVEKIVKLNRRFIPPYGTGASLYIRPLLIGTSGIVGVKPSHEYLFLIFVTPVGPYFKGGLKPINLLVIEDIDRAAPFGTGDVKVGGNYAAGMRATKKAKDLGYDEVLYLDARHKKYIDESGPANFFGITKDNKYVTPKSTSILPSITNKSLQTIAKDLGMTVEQRPVDVEEIFDFKEAGCCGTAAVISPTKSITYRDRKVTYLEDDEVGEVCRKLYDQLRGIQLGTIEDKYGWNYKITMD